MYQAFCNHNGLRTSVVKYENINGTGEAGVPLSEAIFEVENENAYGIFRCEAGVHRVQRVPATETKENTYERSFGACSTKSTREFGSTGRL